MKDIAEIRKRIFFLNNHRPLKNNGSMGGVDRADQNLAAYLIGLRSKMVMAIICLDSGHAHAKCMGVVSSTKTFFRKKHDLLSFRIEVVFVYLAKYSSNNSSRSRIASVPHDIRFDRRGHFSDQSPTTKTWGLCKRKTCVLQVVY